MGLAINPQQIQDLAKALAPAITAQVNSAVSTVVKDEVAKAVIEASKGKRSDLPGAGAEVIPVPGDASSGSIALGLAMREAREHAKSFGGCGLEASFKDYKTGRPVIEGTGIMLARALKAEMVSRLSNGQVSAVQVAKAWGYTDLSKALQQNLFTAGGSLVHEMYAAELVPLLRNVSIVRRAGARVVPMGATLKWDRQTAAATAGYVGELQPPASSQPATDMFELSEKKLMAFTPFSNDLIRNASISAEEFVRNDLVNVMGLREDLAFLRGDGTSGTPRGIRFRLASGNVYVETITSEGAPTLAEALAELAKARKKLRRGNIPFVRPVWLVSPNFEAGLDSIASPGGDGTNLLAAEYANKGTIKGYPVFVSNQVPINVKDDGTGGTGSTASYDRSEIDLVDMNEVVIGESLALEVEFFPNAAVSISGTVQSGVSQDMSTFRSIAKHDVNMFHTTGGVCISNSSWGQ